MYCVCFVLLSFNLVELSRQLKDSQSSFIFTLPSLLPKVQDAIKRAGIPIKVMKLTLCRWGKWGSRTVAHRSVTRGRRTDVHRTIAHFIDRQ